MKCLQQVFFDLEIGGKKEGRVTFELFADVVIFSYPLIVVMH